MRGEGGDETKSGGFFERNIDDGQIVIAIAYCDQCLFGVAGLAAKQQIGLKVDNLR